MSVSLFLLANLHREQLNRPALTIYGYDFCLSEFFNFRHVNKILTLYC